MSVVPTNPATLDVHRVEFRQSADFVTFCRWFGAFVIVFLTAWCVLVVVAGAWFWVPIGVGMAAAITVWLRRVERLAVVAEGEELVITNMLRTRRIDRGEIERFLHGRRHLHVDLRNRMMPEVCDLFAIYGLGARSDADACAERLNAWLGRRR